MSPSVAAIIYFACGFPIAMYLVIRRRPTLGKLIVWSLFWPVFAVTLLFRLIKPTAEMRENSRRLRIECIAAAIERDAFDGGSMANVFEFREVFYRYAGLAEAAATPVGDIAELHERCIARNNRKKLTFHTDAARAEFIDAVTSFAAEERIAAVRNAVDLAEYLGDADAHSRLNGLLAEPHSTATVRQVDTRAVS